MSHFPFPELLLQLTDALAGQAVHTELAGLTDAIDLARPTVHQAL